jgi:hypothetical protein
MPLTLASGMPSTTLWLTNVAPSKQKAPLRDVPAHSRPLMSKNSARTLPPASPSRSVKRVKAGDAFASCRTRLRSVPNHITPDGPSAMAQTSPLAAQSTPSRRCGFSPAKRHGPETSLHQIVPCESSNSASLWLEGSWRCTTVSKFVPASRASPKWLEAHNRPRRSLSSATTRRLGSPFVSVNVTNGRTACGS